MTWLKPIEGEGTSGGAGGRVMPSCGSFERDLLQELTHDLKAMRLAARVSVEAMATRLGIEPGTFRDLEDGTVVPGKDLLEEWQRAVGFALCHAARQRSSASRALRRWFFKLS